MTMQRRIARCYFLAPFFFPFLPFRHFCYRPALPYPLDGPSIPHPPTIATTATLKMTRFNFGFGSEGGSGRE